MDKLLLYYYAWLTGVSAIIGFTTTLFIIWAFSGFVGGWKASIETVGVKAFLAGLSIAAIVSAIFAVLIVVVKAALI